MVIVRCVFDGGDGIPGCGTRLASAGYAVYGMDYEGHGRSMGARCYIKKIDDVVTDCDRFFKSISEEEGNREKRRFLYGESMGGAVSLLLHLKDPAYWDGAVLVAPMCKVSPSAVILFNLYVLLLLLLLFEGDGGEQISENVKPHPLVIAVLTMMEEIIPKWKVVPLKDLYDNGFKDPIKRQQIRANTLVYKDKPRLKTALELLRTSIQIEESLSKVTLPFYVLHGEADTVTDPEVSRALYERASSKDKTMKLYPGMWHALTTGEPDGNIDAVYADIVAWLCERDGPRGQQLPPNVSEEGDYGGFRPGPAPDEAAGAGSGHRGNGKRGLSAG
ncbi:hypothetical protein KSP40_PGU022515 [Platanthera guangdongensis]|uniref:Serine aminopeptidase S33 domain-containing protein n=1 Tax=Platanthera guangdongensis TaxID=2320717 RepID=A0ABR2M804_9ASPA